MRRYILAALAALAVAAPTATTAQPNSGVMPESADGAFLKYIATDSEGEIQLCQLALKKTQDADVKAFAQRMISDHTAAIAKATALAKSTGVSNFMVTPSDDAEIEYAHLSTYSGHEFDEEFVKHNVMDHSADIDTTRHAMEVASNADVKAFETQELPQLEEHLRLAQRASDSVAARRD